jgi:hypothetical protein
MNENKMVKLTKYMQLIDLNKELTNFDINFSVKERSGKSFQLAVVDQTTLDSGSDIQYETINGETSANLISNKDVYQNYFLCLKTIENKSDNVVVDININGREIPAETVTNTTQNTTQNTTPQIVKTETGVVAFLKKNWKVIVAVIVLITIGVFVYYYYFNKSSTVNDNSTPKLLESINDSLSPVKPDIECKPDNATTIETIPVQVTPTPPTQTLPQPPSPTSPLNTNLLNKLKNI